MANAQADFVDMTNQQVAPMLRSRGFKGTRGTWSNTSAKGDCALVNIQKSRWNTANEVGFTVNLSLVPRPWFEWQSKQYGFPPSRKPREENGLWRDRLRPTSALTQDGQFWVIRDSRTALDCARDVIDQLQHTGLQRLLTLLDREALMQTIRAEDFGYIKMSPLIPMVVMLSDSGPSAELAQAVKRLETDLPGFRDWKLRDEFLTWVWDRAAER